MFEIHPIFVFEVAQAIDLDRAEQLLAGAERPTFRHRGRATALFHYRPAPLRIAQEWLVAITPLDQSVKPPLASVGALRPVVVPSPSCP